MSKPIFSVTLENNAKEIREAEEWAVERGLQGIGMTAVTLTHRKDSMGGTPVVTGRLKNSIAWATINGAGGGSDGEGGDHASQAGRVPEKTLVIGTNVEYGEAIEEGRQGRGGAHMLRNALTDVGDLAKKIMQANLEAAKD